MSLNEPLPPELEAEAQELAARIRARADQDIMALAPLLVSKKDAEVFGDTEFEARTLVHRVGAAALEERLKKLGYDGSGLDCPRCKQSAKFQGYRPKTPLRLLGDVPCERAYYSCGRCGHGFFPWDQAVGLTACSFSPATERLVCLAGTLSDGFEEAAPKVLPEMAGLRVCPKSGVFAGNGCETLSFLDTLGAAYSAALRARLGLLLLRRLRLTLSFWDTL